MNGCTGTCDQGRTCTCRGDFMTPAENRRFWRTIVIVGLMDIAIIAIIMVL